MAKALVSPTDVIEAPTGGEIDVRRLTKQLKRVWKKALLAGKIDLRPVAGGQQRRAQYMRGAFQSLQQQKLLGFCKGKTLPNVDAGQGMVHAGHADIQSSSISNQS